METKVYQFNELNEDAKKRVVEQMHYINANCDWWDDVYEQFKEQAKNEGFEVSKIYFSGFSSQGDGAMFEYHFEGKKLVNNFIDSLKLSQMRKAWLKNWCDYSGAGKHSGHYYHENSCSHSVEFLAGFYWSRAINVSNWIDSFYSEFEEYIINIYKNLCRDLYKQLEKEYKYLASEAAIIETIEANEYEFTEDGKLV
jgi:hypothetical protein